VSRTAVLAAGLLAATAVRAEPLYVVEQLVVSLNSSADGSGERTATLKSGDRVELIERAGEAAHVRTAEGREGWLKAAYLSGEAPLRPRLAQSEAEVARLRTELAQLRTEHARPAPSAAPLSTPSADEPPPLFATPAPRPPTRSWPWVLLGALAGGGVGFLIGWRALDRRIRAKYGGLRIY